MIRLATLALAGALATTAHAAGSPPKTESAANGAVRATIVYSIPRGAGYFRVHLTIDRAGQRVFDARVRDCSATEYCGTKPVPMHGRKAIAVLDLDGDGEQEILLDLFSGGAHCCWWSRIYRWDSAAHKYMPRAHLWGNVGYKLADLGRDGHLDFVSADDRFSYAFTSFAGSSFPLQVWTFRAGRLVDSTRAYPTLIARDARKQWRWYRRRIGKWEVRGYLAAWAADRCLLGGCRAALARLDRRRSTFSDLYDVSQSGSATSYLRHLRTFLRRTGYWR